MSFIAAGIVSVFLSVVFTIITIRLAKKYKIVDNPKKRKHPAILHSTIIPRAGGVPIFLAFVIASLLFVPFSKQLAGILAGGAILVAIGVLDDKFELKASHRFLAQILAALVVVASGVGISFITNPLRVLDANLPALILLDQWRLYFNFFGIHSVVVWADLFALFWIVWVINMVNFSSGVDGQLGGIALIALLVIFSASLRFLGDPSADVVSMLAIVGAGAALGFLLFNVYPAKIFPGDSGSYFLGFLIAVLAILAGARVGSALLVMAVPLIDGVFTILRRIASGKSPFVGDRNHLHHKLLEIGLSPRLVSLFYWLLCAILGAIALTLPQDQKIFAAVVAAIIILGGLLWLNTNLQIKAQK